MNKQNMVYTTVEYYLAIKRKENLIHPTIYIPRMYMRMKCEVKEASHKTQILYDST
jgi:hypothetical protein